MTTRKTSTARKQKKDMTKQTEARLKKQKARLTVELPESDSPLIGLGKVIVTCDSMQWIVKEVVKGKKTPRLIGYFTGIDGIVLHLYELNLRRIPARSLEDLRDASREFHKYVMMELVPKFEALDIKKGDVK